MNHPNKAKLPSPLLIVAPPLSGCDKLAKITAASSPGIIDIQEYLQVPKDAAISARQEYIGRFITRTRDVRFIVTPCVPESVKLEVLDRIAGIVIISPVQLARELRYLGHQPGAQGTRIAAIQWRDEALALGVAYDIPFYPTLEAVPVIQDISINVGSIAKLHKKGNLHNGSTPNGDHLGYAARTKRPSTIPPRS